MLELESSVSRNIRNFFGGGSFLFRGLGMKSAGFRFWKYNKGFLLRKSRKSFLLREYKEVI